MKDSKKYIIVCSYLEGTIQEALNFSNWDLDNSTLVCADGGLNLVLKENFSPDYLIGDLDSLDKKNLDIALSVNPLMEVIQHPEDKDETDTSIAIEFAIKNGCEEILIIGGLGGRIDHTIAIIQTLGSLVDLNSEDNFKAYLCNGCNLFFITNNKKTTLQKSLGKYFSIFAFTDNLTNVTIKNAKYTLENYHMKNSFPIGVSNEFINDDPVIIEKDEGLAIIIVSRDKI